MKGEGMMKVMEATPYSKAWVGWGNKRFHRLSRSNVGCVGVFAY